MSPVKLGLHASTCWWCEAGSSQMQSSDGVRQRLGLEAAEAPDVDQWALEKSALGFPGDLCSTCLLHLLGLVFMEQKQVLSGCFMSVV